MKIGSILDFKKASFFKKAVMVAFFVPLMTILPFFIKGYQTRFSDTGPVLEGKSLLHWVVLLKDGDESAGDEASKRILSLNREVIMPVAAAWVHRRDSFSSEIYFGTLAIFMGKSYYFPEKGIPRHGVDAGTYQLYGLRIIEQFGRSMPVAVQALQQLANEPKTFENAWSQEEAEVILKKWAGKE